MRITVLGPQRRPTVDAVVRSFGLDGPLATVTAGWLEREPDDSELNALLGGRTINLALYGRWLDVQERDVEYVLAYRDHESVLDELHELYLVQLEHAVEAVYDIARRGEAPRARRAALADAEAAVALLDRRHLQRVADVQADFEAAWPAGQRPVIAEHRAAVRQVLGQVAAIVVAGGHVGVLLRVLRLFEVEANLPATIVAWSAGAMALTQRLVLFNDYAARGPTHAEVYDAGLGVVRAVVLLPHARRRLRIDEPMRMGVLARRFAPARCVVLDDGVRVDLTEAGDLPPGARVVDDDGRITAVEPG